LKQGALFHPVLSIRDVHSGGQWVSGHIYFIVFKD